MSDMSTTTTGATSHTTRNRCLAIVIGAFALIGAGYGVY